MKKYEGYLGEIEYLIDKNALTEEHPYYKVYEYIIYSNRETLIKKEIKNNLLNEINRIKTIFFIDAEEDCKKIDLTMLPWLKESYNSIITRDYSRIQTLIRLLEPEKLDEFINEIYIETTSNAELEKTNTIIEKNYKTIIEKCLMSLNGLKFQNELFVKDKEINMDIVSKFYETLNEKDMLAINIIKKEEEKRNKLTIECNQINTILENKEKITCTYILETTDKKIKEIDKRILRILNKENKIFEYLLKQNIIEKYNNIITINITTDRLKELNISGDLFELLNIRCRLLLIQNIINDNIKENKTKIILGKEDKECLEHIIEHKDLEEIEPRFIKVKFTEIIDEFKAIKEKQFNQKTKELSDIMHNQELYKTELLKKIEQNSENNIYAIYLPTPLGITSRGNAIYIINVLKQIKEDEQTLINFLSNPSITILTPQQENKILNITKEKLVQYIEKETIISKEDNQKQLRLILKENKNAK